MLDPQTGAKELQIRTIHEQQLETFFGQPGMKDSFLKKWREATKTKPRSGIPSPSLFSYCLGSVFVDFIGDEGHMVLPITKNILSSVLCPHGYIIQDVAPECIREAIIFILLH